MKNLSIRNKRNRPPCTLGGVYFITIDEISDERWIEGEQIENYMAKFGDEQTVFCDD